VALGELYKGALKSTIRKSIALKIDEFLRVAAVLYPDAATAS
jgi:hypothetical protein